eukprot:5772636-Lingulodinium_polyedra.AAC.1
MKPTFDLALHKSVVHLRGSGDQSLKVWWASVEYGADLVLPKDDVRAVLELPKDKSWTEVKDQLERISKASPVGAFMFKKPLEGLQRQESSEAVAVSVDKLKQASTIIADTVETERNAFIAYCTKVGLSPSETFHRRAVSIE